MAARKKAKSKRTTASAKSTVANVIDTGHHIWLAGLGALVRAQREGSKLFDTLVEEGTSAEQHQRANAPHLIKNALGMPTSQEIDALSRKIDELNRSVQALMHNKTTAAHKPTAHAADMEAPF